MFYNHPVVSKTWSSTAPSSTVCANREVDRARLVGYTFPKLFCPPMSGGLLGEPMRILDAYRLAAELHAGQTDKSARPYIEHLTRVFLKVLAAGGDRYQQIAALLHDAIEDGRATAESLAAAGVPAQSITLVLALTRQGNEPYEQYTRTVLKTEGAALIKRADVEDNSDPDRLALLDEETAARLSRKYAKAKSLLDQQI